MKTGKYNVPVAAVAVALSEMLLNGFCQRPDVLVEVIRRGEDEFVTHGMASDRQGLSKADYRKIFRKLARAHDALGLPRLPKIH